jgi:tetratricopeptide (TPR) repeat protein
MQKNYRGYRWFGEVLKIKPDGQEYYEKGLSMAKLGRYDDALISYNKAIKIKVDYCEAFSTKGLAVAKTERTSLSEKLLS